LGGERNFKGAEIKGAQKLRALRLLTAIFFVLTNVRIIQIFIENIITRSEYKEYKE